jgi:hypothetical protein
MEITLSHIPDAPIAHTFRVAFHSSSQRCLLPYPEVTGLEFCEVGGKPIAEWCTSRLEQKPLDDFVLNPRARIAFDLYANINHCDGESSKWFIELPRGRYLVRYVYHVEKDADWYDFLQKRSRFVDMTPIWKGAVRSNSIDFEMH